MLKSKKREFEAQQSKRKHIMKARATPALRLMHSHMFGSVRRQVPLQCQARQPGAVQTQGVPQPTVVDQQRRALTLLGLARQALKRMEVLDDIADDPSFFFQVISGTHTIDRCVSRATRALRSSPRLRPSRVRSSSAATSPSDTMKRHVLPCSQRRARVSFNARMRTQEPLLIDVNVNMDGESRVGSTAPERAAEHAATSLPA